MSRKEERGTLHRCSLTEEPVDFQVIGRKQRSGVEYAIIELGSGARLLGRRLRDWEVRSDFKHSDYLVSEGSFYVLTGLVPETGFLPMSSGSVEAVGGHLVRT